MSVLDRHHLTSSSLPSLYRPTVGSHDAKSKTTLKLKLKNTIFSKQRSRSASNSPTLPQSGSFASFGEPPSSPKYLRFRSHSLPNVADASPFVTPIELQPPIVPSTPIHESYSTTSLHSTPIHEPSYKHSTNEQYYRHSSNYNEQYNDDNRHSSSYNELFDAQAHHNPKYYSLILEDSCDCADCNYQVEEMHPSTPATPAPTTRRNKPSLSSTCSSIQEEQEFETQDTQDIDDPHPFDEELMIDKMADSILDVVAGSTNRDTQLRWGI